MDAVEESFPVREAAGPPEGAAAAAADDPLLAPADEVVDGWDVRFEQQFNIFLSVSDAARQAAESRFQI